MLSNNKIKYILSLHRKKVRDEEKLFIIEGDKIVKDFLHSKLQIKTLVAVPEFISDLDKDKVDGIPEVLTVNAGELNKISGLKTAHNALALVRIPETSLSPEEIFLGLCPVLDFIQDPGNLGTIIRAAAWFGFSDLICSENCVDVYNPKVVQATMGALINVRVHYISLGSLLKSASVSAMPVYGTLLDGENIYKAKLGKRGLILLGNESKGISREILPFITHKLHIPKFACSSEGIDSLNAAMAASVVFSEFRRRE